MSKRCMIAASVLAVVGLSGSAMAAGLIRSPGVGTNKHAALGLGLGSFSISSYGTLTNNNPTNTFTDPFGSAGSNTAIAYTDVDANSSAGSNFKNVFATTNAQTQLRSTQWYFNVSGTPRAIATSLAGTKSESYSGPLGIVRMTDVGTASWRADLTFYYFISEGAADGQMNVTASMYAKRRNITGSSSNTQPISFSAGNLFDLEVGSNGASSDVVTDVSGSGERRLLFTDSSGVTAQALALSPSSFSVNTGSIVTNTSNLRASTALNNTITASTSDQAAGFVWNFTLNPVGTAGDSFWAVSAFSINSTASVPEPTTLAILGGTALVALRRRSR